MIISDELKKDMTKRIVDEIRHVNQVVIEVADGSIEIFLAKDNEKVLHVGVYNVNTGDVITLDLPEVIPFSMV